MKLWLALAVIVVVVAALLFLAKVPLGYNIRNLIVRWRVTLMTALAFTLVVALLTVMLAFVNGMYRLTENSGQPGNVIVMADGATDELFSNMSRDKVSTLALNPDAAPRVVRVMHQGQQTPLVSFEVYIVVNQPVPAAEGEKPRRRFIQVRGIDDPVLSGKVHGLELYPGGQWFSQAGVRTLRLSPMETVDAVEGVLGEGIARDLGRQVGKERLEVGDTFDLGGRTWVATGIMKSLGSTFGSEIWAKGKLVGERFGKDQYTSIVMKTGSAEQAKELAPLLTKNYKEGGTAVQAQTEDEYYSKLSATNQQFLYAIVFVAAIMSVGGVFGVMNTMFAAISQRTRDIGVLRIMGFAPWQVLVSFFIESLWIALAGGLLGLAIGYLTDGYTASSIVSGGQGGGKSVVFKLVVDANILAVGMLFTLAMGGIGGLLPALSAMRLKPLEAIR
jgi:ABC-type lipoprotein release transport system permease subunit